jgi:hypothetical protein
LTPLKYDLLFNVKDTFANAKLGFLCINDQKYACVSGKHGLGALPKGMYTLDKCYKLKKVMKEKKDKNGKVIIKNGKVVIINKVKAYTGKEFAWVATLTPQFKTNRSKLLIHPDGGVEGTRGCIGIKNRDKQAFHQITNLLKVKKELILYVDK